MVTSPPSSKRRRSRRRRSSWWSQFASQIEPRLVVTLALSLAGTWGWGKTQETRQAGEVVAARQQVHAVGQNAALIVRVLAVAVDSLDVRVSALDGRVAELEDENGRLRRRVGLAARREPTIDTLYLYDAATYGPQPKPPGFVSRLAGAFTFWN